MTYIDNNNFETEVLAQKGKTVLDFYAVWCGPCKMLSPTVDEIAEEYEGRAIVAKCNVDDADDVAMQYRIRNIPTLLFFKNGELAERLVGVVSKQEIAAVLDSLM